jgi:hypothetical protein
MSHPAPLALSWGSAQGPASRVETVTPSCFKLQIAREGAAWPWAFGPTRNCSKMQVPTIDFDITPARV